MVKVFQKSKNEFYIDGYLKQNLDHAKNVVKKDWDMVFLVDGVEGSGKSVLAMQIGFFCDPTLTLDRIVFTPSDFQSAIIKAKKYQTVIYDEAYTGLSSRAAMSQINKTLIKMLAEIRQKNLFVLVVMPTFFDVDKYVALWRSRALIHVYTGDRFERGFFSFFNGERKKNLYVNGKKFYNYNLVKPNFRGRFMNSYTVNEEKYRLKKRNSLIDYTEDKKQLNQELEDYKKERFLALQREDIPHRIKMVALGLSEANYYRIKRKLVKEIVQKAGN